MEVIEKTVEYNEISSIESLCMQCQENGETRIMLMKVPFFKDIIVMSFNCSKCGFKNNEIQSNAQLQEKGVKYTFKVAKKEDLERMVVAGIRSLVYLPELDFEVPNLNKGLVSTISGFIRMFRQDLEMNQEQRKQRDPELVQKIDAFCEKLKKLEKGDDSVLPYYFVLDDASGNSHISNPYAPLPDNQLKEERYVQTKEQLYRLGYVSDVEMAEDKEAQQKYQNIMSDYKNADIKKQKERGLTDKEVSEMMVKMQGFNKKKDAHQLDYSKPITEQDIDKGACMIEVECFACGKIGQMRTCCCQLPFFKEITLMAFTCDHCGYKDSEVKTAGEISEKGKKITLKVQSTDDFNRDVFKSDTAEIFIPELEFSMNPGTLGSFYSTIEGVLDKIYENLRERNPFVGDSALDEQKKKFDEFLDKFDNYRNGKVLPFTIIIDDPLDNCFILNPYYPQEDPQVEVEEYERTDEQNEDLERVQEIDHIDLQIDSLKKRVNSLKEKYKKQSFQYSHSQLELQLSELKNVQESLKFRISQFSNLLRIKPIKQNILKGMKVCLDNRIMKIDYEIKVLNFRIKQQKDTKKKPQNNMKYNFGRNNIKKRYYQNLSEEQTKNNFQQNLMQEKNQNIQNQNTQLSKINQTLNQVVQSFQKMTEVVQHQDEMIADIEVNTSDASENMKQGKDILFKIYQDVNANRQLIIKFFLIMLVISIVYLKFL